DFALDTLPVPASADLNANQREKNDFQVLSFQSSLGAGTDYQISLLHRYSDVHYEPDPAGDLAYFGVAANVLRKNETTGLQFDLSSVINERHTLRAGLFAQREHGAVDDNALVFPADADGNQTSGTPIAITDNAKVGG